MSRISVSHPLIRMRKGHKLFFVLYLIVFSWIPSIIQLQDLPGQSVSIYALLFILQACFHLIQILPFTRQKIGGIETGWLHPLVFSAVLNVAISILKDPTSAFLLERETAAAGAFKSHTGFAGSDAALLELKRLTLTLIAQLAYVAAFLKPPAKCKCSNSNTYKVRNWGFRFVIYLLFGVFAWLMIDGGGVVAYFSRLAFGRAVAAREIGGGYIVLVRSLPFVLMLWSLSQRGVYRTLEFKALMLSSIVAVFITTGSRSMIFIAAACFLMAWMMEYQRIPLVGTLALICAGSLLLGTLADLRRSALYNDGEADITILSDIADIENAVERTRNNISRNSEVRGDLAVLSTVPKTHPFLMGQSYVGAATFFLPRNLWEEKPRSAGAFVGALIYDQLQNTSGYLGAAYPPGAVAEAYWNFAEVGVVIVFFLFGKFQNRLTNVFLQKPTEPLRRSLYIVALLVFTTPSSDDFIPFAQISAILIFVALICLRRNERQYSWR